MFSDALAGSSLRAGGREYTGSAATRKVEGVQLRSRTGEELMPLGTNYLRGEVLWRQAEDTAEQGA